MPGLIVQTQRQRTESSGTLHRARFETLKGLLGRAFGGPGAIGQQPFHLGFQTGIST
jgi:hypothetical protein